jgi:hypothetical protein
MSTIHFGALVLNDGWPGLPNPNLTIPDDGWNNTTDNFTTTSANQATPYPVGTKIQFYSANPENPGYYTMMYLMYTDYSDNDIEATDYSLNKAFCAHFDASTAEKYASDTSAVPYYVVSKCYTVVSSDITHGVPIAVPCATLGADGTAVQVTGYGDAYGWFWVGGVCPLDDVSLFRGALDTSKGFDISVDTLMRDGPLMMCMTAHIAWLSSMDATNYGDSTAFTNTLHNLGHPIAFACTSAI